MLASAWWLRTNLAWERRDAHETSVLLRLTVAADGRPLCFWLNGARMMAYDFPSWENGEALPAVIRAGRANEHASEALRFLEEGARQHPDAAELYLEMANIRRRVLHDAAGAVALLERARDCPGAPYYIGRLHAELLRELGRPREALNSLCHQLPSLPADEPAARRDVVLARIKALEAELGLP